ncbi:DUF2326 domain-containing protein [Corynebacterium casei]|uniref:DUF2326 domain-containing protein n=1 Tax=Corynebacterium casei TaxID=160386 RepID=UPI001D0308BA|nr:DUF2326 domain-containing protein [Corynebacterium casei]
MLIKSMEIVSQNTGSVIRRINFHRGTNFIVDSQDSETHNKVGKTTFLKVINLLLGNDKRKSLYFNDEINANNPELEVLINSDKVFVEGVFGAVLEGEDELEFTLRVDLFNRGKRFINHQEVSKEEYNKRLKELFFQSSTPKPGFRQLIGLFVRVVASGDDSSFLNFLIRSSNAEHRASYEFIFGIVGGENTIQYEDARAQLERINRSKNDFVRLRGDRSLEGERQVLKTLEEWQQTLKERLSDLTNEEAFVSNRNQAIEDRQRFDALVLEQSELRYELGGVTEQIAKLQDELGHKDDSQLYRGFYDEISTLVPGIQKTFEEMIEFNLALVRNRLSSLESLKMVLEEQLQNNEERLEALKAKNDSGFSIVALDGFTEYEEILTQLGKTEQLIGSSKEAIEALEVFDNQMRNLKDEIRELASLNSTDAKIRSTVDAMARFNKYFTQYASEINGEDPILISDQDAKKFPLSIEQLGGTSTGTRKSLISAFDLALQSFLSESGRVYPEFVVHDVMESVEGKHLKAVFEIANSIRCQYIVAALNEKLVSSELSQEDISNSTVLVLGKDDRLFEPK